MSESSLHNISCLVTVTVEEDQINTPTCSPGAFIRQLYKRAELDLRLTKKVLKTHFK